MSVRLKEVTRREEEGSAADPVRLTVVAWRAEIENVGWWGR